MTRHPAQSGSTGRSLLPQLPARVWLLLSAFLFYVVSSGMNVPYQAIYLHTVNGYSTASAGEVLTTSAMATVVATFAGGWLIDRFGAAWTLLGGLLLLAAGYVVFSVATELWVTFLAAIALGVGFGGLGSAMRSLLVRMTTTQQRADAFSLQYVAVNVGLGAGGALGGVVLGLSLPRAFQLLFWWAAVAATLAGVVAVAVSPAVARGAEERPARGGFRAVMADRAWLMLAAVQVVAAILITQINHAIPLYLNAFRGVPEYTIGLLLFANAAVVIGLQVPVTRLVSTVRRTRVVALMGGIWAVAWLAGAASSLLDWHRAQPLLLVFYILLALGECLMSPSLTVLMTDAPNPALIGQYASLSQMAWSIGVGVSPAVGLFIVGLPAHALIWPVGALAAMLIVPWSAWIGALIRPQLDDPTLRGTKAA